MTSKEQNPINRACPVNCVGNQKYPPENVEDCKNQIRELNEEVVRLQNLHQPKIDWEKIENPYSYTFENKPIPKFEIQSRCFQEGVEACKKVVEG